MVITPYLIASVAIVSYCLWFIYRKILWPWAKLDTIPGPPSKPFLGVSLEISKYRDWEDFIVSMQEKYGPVFKLNFPFTTVICLGDLDLIRSVLQNPKSPAYEFLSPLLGKGLATSEGPKWQHDRRLLDAAFSFKYIRNLHETMVKHTKILIHRWEQIQADQTLNLNRELANYAFDITGETALGIEFNAIQQTEKHPLLGAFEETLRILYRRRTFIWERYNLLSRQTLNRKLELIQNEVKPLIQKRRKEHEESEFRRHDILDILLTKNPETDQNEFTDEEIIEQMNTFLFGGTDSTSASISMAIYFLLQNPDALQKCLKELRALEEKKFVPVYDDLKEMNYLQRVINETLRLASPGSSARQFTDADVKLFGMESVPQHADTILYIVPSMIHHNTKYWTNPKQFDPDRFLPENSANRDSSAFMPFLAGKRNCIGKNFALMEMKIALSMILPRFAFSLVPGHEVKSIDQLDASRDKGGVLVYMHKREQDAVHA